MTGKISHLEFPQETVITSCCISNEILQTTDSQQSPSLLLFGTSSGRLLGLEINSYEKDFEAYEWLDLGSGIDESYIPSNGSDEPAPYVSLAEIQTQKSADFSLFIGLNIHGKLTVWAFNGALSNWSIHGLKSGLDTEQEFIQDIKVCNQTLFVRKEDKFDLYRFNVSKRTKSLNISGPVSDIPIENTGGNTESFAMLRLQAITDSVSAFCASFQAGNDSIQIISGKIDSKDCSFFPKIFVDPNEFIPLDISFDKGGQSPYFLLGDKISVKFSQERSTGKYRSIASLSDIKPDIPLSELGNFFSSDENIKNIRQARAFFDGELFFDKILSIFGIESSFYPPTQASLGALLENIFNHEKIELSRKHCIVYYLLCFLNDSGEKYADKFNLSTPFKKLMKGYWLMDNLELMEGSRTLLNLEADWPEKIIGALYKKRNYKQALSCPLKFEVESMDMQHISLIIDMLIYESEVSKALETYRNYFISDSPKAFVRILDRCFERENWKLLQSLLSFKFEEKEERIIEIYCGKSDKKICREFYLLFLVTNGEHAKAIAYFGKRKNDFPPDINFMMKNLELSSNLKNFGPEYVNRATYASDEYDVNESDIVPHETTKMSSSITPQIEKFRKKERKGRRLSSLSFVAAPESYLDSPRKIQENESVPPSEWASQYSFNEQHSQNLDISDIKAEDNSSIAESSFLLESRHQSKGGEGQGNLARKSAAKGKAPFKKEFFGENPILSPIASKTKDDPIAKKSNATKHKEHRQSFIGEYVNPPSYNEDHSAETRFISSHPEAKRQRSESASPKKSSNIYIESLKPTAINYHEEPLPGSRDRTSVSNPQKSEISGTTGKISGEEVPSLKPAPKISPAPKDKTSLKKVSAGSPRKTNEPSLSSSPLKAVASLFKHGTLNKDIVNPGDVVVEEPLLDIRAHSSPLSHHKRVKVVESAEDHTELSNRKVEKSQKGDENVASSSKKHSSSKKSNSKKLDDVQDTGSLSVKADKDSAVRMMTVKQLRNRRVASPVIMNPGSSTKKSASDQKSNNSSVARRSSSSTKGTSSIKSSSTPKPKEKRNTSTPKTTGGTPISRRMITRSMNKK